jgi:hypothetical protein
MMMVGRRVFLIAIPLAFLIARDTARAEQTWSWDGVWTGRLSNTSVISVTIAKNKVVNYLFMGAPMPIQYNDLNAKNVSFGDRDHYNMTLTKTGDISASALYYGRNGYASATLVKR